MKRARWSRRSAPWKVRLWDPREAQVDNRALGSALAAAFVRAGGALSSNEAVVRIAVHEGRAVSAHTPVAIHHADAFVLAAGAWSGLIEAFRRKPCRRSSQ